MATPVVHKRTEPLRELVKQLDAAALFAKPVYVRELTDQTVTVLAEFAHKLDELERRVAALERFPEAT
jgi:hypothetical protein